MKFRGITIAAVLFIFSFLAGCTAVRTYTEDKDRVDQNLSAGNQGYLMGTPKEMPGERKLKRKTYVTEIELGFPANAKKKAVKTSQGAMKVETAQEPAGEPVMEQAPAAQKTGSVSTKVTRYVVQPNETLQKISQKVYGSSKKWKKIFDANSDKLKSPDRIYAGQELKIPQE